MVSVNTGHLFDCYFKTSVRRLTICISSGSGAGVSFLSFSLCQDPLFLCVPDRAADGNKEFRLGRLGKTISHPSRTLSQLHAEEVEITHPSTKVQILLLLKSFLTAVSVLGMACALGPLKFPEHTS